MQAAARLFVLGGHPRAGGASRLQLDHHVDRVVRGVVRPVLVVAGAAFEPPRRFMIAFDGSATARRAVQAVARSPLLAGLPALLATAGDDTPATRRHLDEARQALEGAGFEVATEGVQGEPAAALPALARARGIGLLVTGAHGHSRMREFIVGSTTTALLRSGEVPVLVLR